MVLTDESTCYRPQMDAPKVATEISRVRSRQKNTTTATHFQSRVKGPRTTSIRAMFDKLLTSQRHSNVSCLEGLRSTLLYTSGPLVYCILCVTNLKPSRALQIINQGLSAVCISGFSGILQLVLYCTWIIPLKVVSRFR